MLEPRKFLFPFAQLSNALCFSCFSYLTIDRGGGTCAAVCMPQCTLWRAEAHLWELVLSFHCAVHLGVELRAPDLAAGALSR